MAPADITQLLQQHFLYFHQYPLEKYELLTKSTTFDLVLTISHSSIPAITPREATGLVTKQLLQHVSIDLGN